MIWPTPADYQEAVQNPQYCFGDAALKQSEPVLNELGLPRVASGNFACVYQLNCGLRSWAVRCFIRPVSHQVYHYRRLSDFVRRQPVDLMVGFEYEERGILIEDNWYPILKMDWVKGETLNEYVAHHLGDTEALSDLCDQWLNLVSTLRSHGIAHGDLSHGNVLVAHNRLWLVDYDCMFVPMYLGQEAPELGHPNYQHPARTLKDFHAGLDNFAAMVIYTSLRALVESPELWEEYHTGDNLLFTREDFIAPQESRLMRCLEQHGSEAVRKASTTLANACRAPWVETPGIESVIEPDTSVALGGKPQKVKNRAASAALTLTSSPDHAQVYVDGELRGITPLKLQDEHALTAGKHELRVELPGYEPFVRVINLRPGVHHRGHAELQPLLAELLVISDPPEASVYLDGEFRGFAPVSFDGTDGVAPGEHLLRVSSEGFRDYVTPVSLRAGERKEVQAVLTLDVVDG